MQAVILAGGLGKRLWPLTQRLPKCLLPVGRRPFLEHQIELLRRNGIRDIVLCVGYLGDRILRHFGDGAAFGVRLAYGWELNGLLGTAGAIKNAEAILEREFFVIYGDSYLPLDYRAVMNAFRQSDKLAMMVVYRNCNRYDRSNVAVGDGLVLAYDKENPRPDMVYINYGVSLLRKRALRLIPEGVPFSQEEFYQELIRRGELLAYETPQRFYEIGSRRGLAEFRELVSQGGVPR